MTDRDLFNDGHGFRPFSQRRRPERAIVFLREIDGGTDNACWVVCNGMDPGAVRFERAD